MVTFLAESDRVQYEENERKSKQEQQKDDGDDDDDGDEENSKPSMQQVHGIWFQKVEEKEENADGTCDDDAIAVNQEEKDSDNGETSDEIEGKDNKEIEGNNNKEISIESKEGPLVGFTLQASQQYEKSSPSRRDLRKVRSRMRKEKSSLRRQASKALRRERSEKMRQWADIVWDVTSQKTPAAAPHELLVMIVILVWVVVLSFVGWYNYYAVTDGGADEVAQKNRGHRCHHQHCFFLRGPAQQYQHDPQNEEIRHNPPSLHDHVYPGLYFLGSLCGRDKGRHPRHTECAGTLVLSHSVGPIDDISKN